MPLSLNASSSLPHDAVLQSGAHGGSGRIALEQLAHGRRDARQVVQVVAMHRHQDRADVRLPEAADQRGARGVLRE